MGEGETNCKAFYKCRPSIYIVHIILKKYSYASLNSKKVMVVVIISQVQYRSSKGNKKTQSLSSAMCQTSTAQNEAPLFKKKVL